MRLSQHLVLTPQLQQAIKLLQLSRLELVDEIRREMEQNPLLEEPTETASSELNETPAEHGAAMMDEMGTSEQAPEPTRDVSQTTQDVANNEVQRSDIDWEQYLDNYQTQHTAPSGAGGMSSEDLPSLEATLTRPEGLTEHLLEQLRAARFDDEEELIGAMIIGNLDRDGYLVLDPDGPTALEQEAARGLDGTAHAEIAEATDAEAAPVAELPPIDAIRPEELSGLDELARAEAEVAELARELRVSGKSSIALERATAALEATVAAKEVSQEPKEPPKRRVAKEREGRVDPLIALALESSIPAVTADKVLKRIQRFDPIGCAARDLRECLEVQAHFFCSEGEGKDNPDAELLPLIVAKHLKNVEAKRYPAIAKDLKVSLEEVVATIKLLGRLEPKPGRLFNVEDAQYITPDVYIHKVGDDYVAQLNDDGLSKLRISQKYRAALKNGEAQGAPAKEYIQEKLRAAVWLIRSIHQRQRTIVKVCDSIIKFQRDFLDKGIAYLKPLILRDVADDIGMHESTVSRVTTNKYVHTQQGIYELKFFFNSSISRVGGEDIASEAVKNQIKQIIAKEPADKPFSDQKIVEILRSQNVDIARRTVAKYREVLAILPSSKRKRYF
jgi:RNA polymerase sigma-54 factor